MKKWIVAVSGGVDSIVLLDRLVKANGAKLIVSHVDHGIRPESGEDAAFVRTCAEMYSLPFELIQLALGAGASEELARTRRWQFLREMRDKHGAEKIVTAHHGDDVCETMVINVLRGTGWRGIATLRETDEIMRPLLAMRKSDIVAYARANELQWREDATNRDQAYLRNYVRHTIMPQTSDGQREQLLGLHAQQCALRERIEQEAAQHTSTRRHQFIMWPDEVAREMLRPYVGSLTQREYDRVLLFIRVGHPSKQLTLSNGKVITLKLREFIVSGQEDC